MNTHQELMTITMEECGELVQRCSKMMRKYEHIEEVEEIQRLKLMEELGDVYAMLMLQIKHGYVTLDELEARSKVKIEKLSVWSKLIHDLPV